VIFGYVLTFFMGGILGLIGGGGSILTVPILVYCFNMPAALATGYSLIIVGTSSALGAIRYHLQGLVNWRLAVLFSAPSVVGVLVARLVLLPMVPNNVNFLAVSVSKDQFILAVFSILVMVISVFMFKSRSIDSDDIGQRLQKRPSMAWIIIDGCVVGVATGFVGAGGGFMIVPALIGLLHMRLKPAIATSLGIIAIKSFIGFAADLISGVHFNIEFTMTLIFITFLGVLTGARLNQFSNPASLRRGFGYFLLAMGLFIVIKEIYFGG
jgi:uncharacterized membrane protein YfcA